MFWLFSFSTQKGINPWVFFCNILYQQMKLLQIAPNLINIVVERGYDNGI